MENLRFLAKTSGGVASDAGSPDMSNFWAGWPKPCFLAYNATQWLPRYLLELSLSKVKDTGSAELDASSIST